jgi:hypothetical protein
MLRSFAALLVLPLAAGCPKSGKGAAAPDAKRVAALEQRVGAIDQRLAKIEKLLGDALEEKVEPDPAAVYAVPIDDDPWVGAEHARVTLVEAFEFA